MLVHQAYTKSTVQKASIYKGENKSFAEERRRRGREKQASSSGFGLFGGGFFPPPKQLEKLLVTKLTPIQHELN